MRISEPHLTEETESYFDIVLDGARRMQDLIRDLLEYSSTGSREVKTEPIRLSSLIDAACDDLETTSASLTLPQHDFTVLAKPNLIRQLLLNLIHNAIKYVPKGEESVIAIEADRVENGGCPDKRQGRGNRDRSEVSWLDLPISSHESIPNTSTLVRGIGLALCKRVVELHGGEIGVESAPGEGFDVLVHSQLRPISGLSILRIRRL